MVIGTNAALNGFLAILENRPEDARGMFAPEFAHPANFHTLVGRIQQARENIKCQAVRDAIRQVYDQTLRLQPVPSYGVEVAEAYFHGVQAVEEILAQMLKICDTVEKKLGPDTTHVP